MTKQKKEKAEKIIGTIIDTFGKDEYDSLKNAIQEARDLGKTDLEIKEEVQKKVDEFSKYLEGIGLNASLADAVLAKIENYLNCRA